MIKWKNRQKMSKNGEKILRRVFNKLHLLKKCCEWVIITKNEKEEKGNEEEGTEDERYHGIDPRTTGNLCKRIGEDSGCVWDDDPKGYCLSERISCSHPDAWNEYDQFVIGTAAYAVWFSIWVGEKCGGEGTDCAKSIGYDQAQGYPDLGF